VVRGELNREPARDWRIVVEERASRRDCIMTSDERSFFEVVDDYARGHHECLITEMFLSQTGVEYVICFRPVVSVEQTGERSGCRYLYVDDNEVQRIGLTKSLSDLLRKTLDAQLPPFIDSLSAGEHRQCGQQ
jgi:hypothetical protein